MRVAAVQFKAESGRREACLSALLDLMVPVARESDLLVAPEMALTGYCFDTREEVEQVAEPADGPTFRALALVAKAHRTWIVCGFPECTPDGRLYNSAMVIDRDGRLAFTYRKTLLFEADWPWAMPGDSGYRSFETGAGSFGVGICMDLNDDRFIAWLRVARPEVLAFPTNWVDEGEPVWPYWRARMTGVPSALVAANSYGPDGEYAFSGRSAIMRNGLVVAAAAPLGDEVVTARV